MGGVLVVVGSPGGSHLAHAQTRAGHARVGVLWGGSPSPAFSAFREGLRALGWVEGQTIAFEERSADARNAALPAPAEELVRSRVNVIVATNAATARAAKEATATIPIVMVGVGDPVRYGLVESLARPGANLTGISFQVSEVIGKQLQLLREVAPRISRVAMFVNPTNLGAAPYLEDARSAAGALGLTIIPAEVATQTDFDLTFTRILRERADSVQVAPESFLNSQRHHLAAFALRERLPLMFTNVANMDAEGLIAYSPLIPDQFRRAASYVDKLLRGASASSLPIEQPTTFELVLNARTARALGLKFPESLLVRANRVLE